MALRQQREYLDGGLATILFAAIYKACNEYVRAELSGCRNRISMVVNAASFVPILIKDYRQRIDSDAVVIEK